MIKVAPRQSPGGATKLWVWMYRKQKNIVKHVTKLACTRSQRFQLWLCMWKSSVWAQVQVWVLQVLQHGLQPQNPKDSAVGHSSANSRFTKLASTSNKHLDASPAPVPQQGVLNPVL